MLLLPLKQVFSKKSAFYVRYLLNNITVMLIPKIQNIILLLKFSQKKKQKKIFAHGVSFTPSDFVNVPHFTLKMEFSKLKLPESMFFLLRAIIKFL